MSKTETIWYVRISGSSTIKVLLEEAAKEYIAEVQWFNRWVPKKHRTRIWVRKWRVL